MNARTLLGQLRDLGVNLTADGDRLRVDAPARSITEQMRTALVENKLRLLELLERERRKLEMADFKLKERCDKIIWQRPDDGFYVSQELALHFLDSRIASTGDKSEVNGKGGYTTGVMAFESRREQHRLDEEVE